MTNDKIIEILKIFAQLNQESKSKFIDFAKDTLHSQEVSHMQNRQADEE